MVGTSIMRIYICLKGMKCVCVQCCTSLYLFIYICSKDVDQTDPKPFAGCFWSSSENYFESTFSFSNNPGSGKWPL